MAVSDVNMSSEGSGSSSRLHQFGLYKTVDSRTAEFLKLSRKRQIRRGCACAAVSTAITVTVVVSALLVYEYGFHTESKMAPNTLRKVNWFNAVNASEVTFDKNKDTLVNNKNNNKLLPIILKALDQKRYLETFIEEHTTPTYEKATEFHLENDLFTEARNWKTPQLKLSEIGHKGPAQGFFKQKQEESFNRFRKLTEYQRIMTYLNTISSNLKIVEPTENHIANAWKPPASAEESYKNDVLNSETTENIKDAEKNDNDKKYCTCSKKSNLADILYKLYNSIQQLRPKMLGTALNSTKRCNMQKSSNNTVHQKSVPNQKAPCIRNNTATSSKHKKISFLRISNKTITFNSDTSTVLTETPVATTDRVKNTSNNESAMSLIQDNHYVMPNKNLTNLTNKEEAIPWTQNFGFITNDVTSKVVMQTEKDITSTITPSPNKKNITKKETEGNRAEKEEPSSPGFDDGSEDDYDIDNLLPESHVYLNHHSAHIDKEKGKVFEESNYLSNYMDNLGKLNSETFVNKSQTELHVEASTKKPFDLKHFFSYETVDPLVKLEKTSAELRRNFKPYQWLSEDQKTGESKSPPSIPTGRSVETRKKSSLAMPKTLHYFESKLETTTEDIKQPHRNALLPMMQSYLLSKHNDKILNLKSDATTSENIVSTKGSEELPFDVRFSANDEESEITKILNDHTTTQTTTTTERTVKAQTWTPPSIKYPKTFTNAPVQTKPKNHKIKEIFYMTGDTPADDFEENLHEIMYNFNSNPVNYTALSNAFLNRTDSGSMEITKSMMPETRPSYLEIRRISNQEELFYPHLYSDLERN